MRSRRHFFVLLSLLVVFACSKELIDLEDKRALFALGDSITYGVGSTNNKSWSDMLSEMLSTNYYQKLAKKGSFCLFHTGYNRLSSQIERIPNNTKGIITLMIGTNDFFYDSALGSADEALAAAYEELDDESTFANAFRYCLIKIQKKAPEANIIVIQPLPTNDIGNKNGHLDESNLFMIRDIERSICNSMNITIVESQEVFGFSRDSDDWSTYFNDFCHPNYAGHERIAVCLFDYIQSHIL